MPSKHIKEPADKLKDAISHLKSMNIVVHANDFIEEWDEKSAEAIATILNAVVKGELK